MFLKKKAPQKPAVPFAHPRGRCACCAAWFIRVSHVACPRCIVASAAAAAVQVDEWQSEFQNEAIPIPTFPPSDDRCSRTPQSVGCAVCVSPSALRRRACPVGPCAVGPAPSALRCRHSPSGPAPPGGLLRVPAPAAALSERMCACEGRSTSSAGSSTSCSSRCACVSVLACACVCVRACVPVRACVHTQRQPCVCVRARLCLCICVVLCCVCSRARTRGCVDVCPCACERAHAHRRVRVPTCVRVHARSCARDRRCGFAGESGLDALPGLALGLVAPPPAAPHCSHARSRARAGSRHRLDRYDKATGKELIGIRSFSMLNRSISAGKATAALTAPPRASISVTIATSPGRCVSCGA
jgi:hypothetical protein